MQTDVLHALLEANRDAIVVIDSDKRFAEFSASAESTLGWSRAEAIGESCQKILKCQDTDGALLCDAGCPLDALLNESSVRSCAAMYILSKNGDVRFLESDYTSVPDRSGKARHFVGVLRNAGEGEWLGSFGAETRRLLSLGTISAGIAHEIRNPLTGIRTTIQYVLKHQDRGDPYRESLHASIKELDRIEAVISDFLAYSRPPSPRRRSRDVNRVLSDSLALARESLESVGVDLVTDMEEELPRLSIDPGMMREVFLNIVMNARDAMRKKGGTLRVSSWLSPRSKPSSPTGIRIAFSDTGPGIPEGTSADIFEPFMSGRAKGLGLGLSISQRICKAHGGLISATNNSEGGSRFTVILPIPQSETRPVLPSKEQREERAKPVSEGSPA
ncbi:MAG: ATP-binding protein [Gemmatimonadota bacterium]|nr:ATP-binding protein [Gemmatimonadota bacterium]MDP6803071.1 ATP-binding protein [Gemmatimonadota bacterium]MDP7032758.1 ATP-binding protein [Gemmatimonadota bacterium]